MILDETINAKDAWLKQVKHHRKRLKGLPRVGFNPNAGNVEHNISMMNMMLGSGEMISNNPVSGPFGGDVSAPAGGTSMGESFDNITKGDSTMVKEIKDYVLELVRAECETGNTLSDDYQSFKRLVADDGYRATKKMYEFYLQCKESDPSCFPAGYEDSQDLDSRFELEFDSREDIEESLEEATNMEKLRKLYPELEESYDKEGNPERCPECNTLLNDMGDCPKCDHGEEDMDEALNEDTLNEGPFDKIKNYFANKKAAKTDVQAADAQGEAKTRENTNKTISNLGKILAPDYNDGTRTFLIDNEWIDAKTFKQKFPSSTIGAQMKDPKLSETNISNYPELAQVLNAVVRDKDGWIVRRGLEVLKPKQVPYNPEAKYLLTIKDGYKAEDIIGKYEETPKQTKEEPKEEPKDSQEKNTPADQQETSKEEPKVDDTQEAPAQQETKPVEDWVNDKSIKATITLLAKRKNGSAIYYDKEGNTVDYRKINLDNVNDVYLDKEATKPFLNAMQSVKDNYAKRKAAVTRNAAIFGESLDDDMAYDSEYSDYPLDEGVSYDDMKDILGTANEIGLKDGKDLTDFIERESEPGESVHDTLRRYRDDLGDDFEIKENFDGSPEVETFDSQDEVDDMSWFNA